jgi:adenine/guanine phosphoribosyltransferase-like PRPP-binding protein
MLPHEFWQQVYPPASFQLEGRHNDRFPATLRDGRQILLPIRPLPDGKRALASLIINQASFAVQDAIAEGLAAELSPLGPALIVGLPTLGLTIASAVARKLGHARYIPLGTSRKYWYDDDLSVPLSSITSPSHSKRLYVDPRMLPLLENSRVALVDDVTSSGVSMAAGIALLAACGVEPVALGVAMLQTERWKSRLTAVGERWPERMRAVFKTPTLVLQSDATWAVSNDLDFGQGK